MLLRARKGRAILLTTHAMEEAQMLCTRIAVLLGGKLQCVGTQQQLLDQVSCLSLWHGNWEGIPSSTGGDQGMP